MPFEHDSHMEVGDVAEDTIEAVEAAEDQTLTEPEKRHIGKIRMRLAVMGHKLGRPLETDIFYGEKIVAQAGQPITRVMVERLREMEPVKLHFTPGGTRRLKSD